MYIEKAKKLLNGIDIKFFLNGTIEQSNYIVDKADEVNKAIETVLSELEKKDKVIDLLADDLRYYEGMQQDQLFCIDTCEGKMCDEEHCKERIKEYFYKKVE